MTNQHPTHNLESQLRAHPAVAPVRPGLAADTLQLARQAQRIRFIRRWLAAAAALGVLLLFSKWLSNDLLYLVQIIFTKTSLIRTQATLYLQAIWESFPKAQFAAIVVTGLLWLGWHRLETSLTHGRITSVKQGHLMKLIKFTPRLAIASLALGAVGLGISGYAYAQKVQQHQLEILRTHINQTGRTQLDTNLATGECDPLKNQNYTNQYEIKKSANITPADAQQIIIAACQLSAGIAYLQGQYPGTPPANNPNVTAFDAIVESGAARVISYQNSSLTAEVSYGSVTQTETIPLDPAVTVYQPGIGRVSLDTLKPGTLVMLAIKNHLAQTYQSSQGQSTSAGYVASSSAAIGLYKLPPTPDFHWYSMQNLITKIQTCMGNPADTCSFTGSIDFFPSGGGEANTINPSVIQDRSLQNKEIAGVITAIGPTTTTIKSSSGRDFTINFGSNPAADFNQHRAQNYNNQQVKVGDTLLVRYVEPADQHTTTIPQDHIFNAVLMLEFTNKTDPVRKY